MTQESDQNKATAVRMWEEVLNNANFPVIREINSPDYKFNGQPMSYDQVEGFVNWMAAQAPGYQFLVDYSVAEGDTVALRWRMNLPAGNKVEPSGKAAHAYGANFLTFAGGQIISNDQAGGVPDVVADDAAPS